jgi:hypothetical protein
MKRFVDPKTGNYRVSWKDAQDMRSKLLAVTRTGNEVIGGQGQGAARLVAREIDAAMEKAAKASSEEAYQSWRAFNEFYKGGRQKYAGRQIKALLDADPDLVFDRVIKARRPAMIRKVMSLADDAQKQQLRGRMIEDMIFDSLDEFGSVSGTKLWGRMQRFGGPDAAALKELLTPTQLQTFQGLTRGIMRAESKAGGNRTGSMIIQFLQASSIFNLVVAPFEGSPLSETMDATSWLILFAPPVLAYTFTNPAAARLLSTGVTAPPGSALAMRAGSQLITHLQQAMDSGAIPKGAVEFFRGNSPEALEKVDGRGNRTE